ncbi:LLM class flavin-dependent oxidoreductase [Yinghuangia aomiensis]
MAAAIAARTERIHLTIAAIPAPLYDPVRLAEEIAVVDLISRGRLTVVLANGYMDSEFAMLGVAMRDRARLTTEAVAVLRGAWSGGPFEHRGRTIRVTPAPVPPRRPPHPARRRRRSGGPPRRPDRRRLRPELARRLGALPGRADPARPPGPGTLYRHRRQIPARLGRPRTGLGAHPAARPARVDGVRLPRRSFRHRGQRHL